MNKLLLSAFLSAICISSLKADCFIGIHVTENGEKKFQFMQLPDHFCCGPYYQIFLVNEGPNESQEEESAEYE